MPRTAQREPADRAVNQFRQMVNQLWQWQFGEYSPAESWTPAVNVYRLERRVEICVDLAGVDPAAIHVAVEPGRLTLRGSREAPEPARRQNQAMRIICMEIDHGQFCRVLQLPRQVNLRGIRTEYTNGLLWIRLPLKTPG